MNIPGESRLSTRPSEAPARSSGLRIYHRRDPTRRILLEIVGFWTPGYLQAKLERLRGAGAPDLILCVDDSLNCTNDASADLRLVRFKRHIDVREVLVRIEAMIFEGRFLG